MITCSLYSLVCCLLVLFFPTVLVVTLSINHYIINRDVSEPTPHDFHPEIIWDNGKVQHLATWVGFGTLVVFGCIILACIKSTFCPRTPRIQTEFYQIPHHYPYPYPAPAPVPPHYQHL
jgi:hypothetical protein